MVLVFGEISDLLPDALPARVDIFCHAAAFVPRSSTATGAAAARLCMVDPSGSAGHALAPWQPLTLEAPTPAALAQPIPWQRLGHAGCIFRGQKGFHEDAKQNGRSDEQRCR